MHTQNSQNELPLGEELSGEGRSLQELHIRGTEVHYYVLCPRKLWWFSHGLEQEHVGDGVGAQAVEMGQTLHRESYPNRSRKDVLIDDLLRLDFTAHGAVQEVKKSRGGQRASLFQLLYYLYYLKHEKGVETHGVLEYPKERRRQEVSLTPDLEAEVERVLDGIQETRARPTPPPVPAPMPICKKCAYQDLCWG